MNCPACGTVTSGVFCENCGARTAGAVHPPAASTASTAARVGGPMVMGQLQALKARIANRKHSLPAADAAVLADAHVTLLGRLWGASVVPMSLRRRITGLYAIAFVLFWLTWSVNGSIFHMEDLGTNADGLLILWATTMAVFAFGLGHGASWARPAAGHLVHSDPTVTAWFAAATTCPVCGAGSAGSSYCGSCGAGQQARIPSLGSRIAERFRYLVLPRPPEPARAQAHAAGPGAAMSHRFLVAAIALGLVALLLEYEVLALHHLLIVAVALIPPILLMLWLREQDPLEREPVSILTMAFAWGIFCGLLAAPLNGWIGGMFSFFDDKPMQAGLVEESAKGLFVMLLFTHRAMRRQINGPLDGLVYGAVAGLGFSAMENIQYILGDFHGNWGAAWTLQGAMLRSVVTVGHATWTGLTGAYLGQALLRHGRITWGDFCVALLPGMLLHAANNGLATILHAEGTGGDAIGAVILGIGAYAFFKVFFEARRDLTLWGPDHGGTASAPTPTTSGPSA